MQYDMYDQQISLINMYKVINIIMAIDNSYPGGLSLHKGVYDIKILNVLSSVVNGE